jgi:hypothetical protein
MGGGVAGAGPGDKNGTELEHLHPGTAPPPRRYPALVFSDRRVTKSAAGLIAPPHVQRVSVRKGLELPCL